MDTVTRDVRDLPPADRSALERLIGHELRETQRVIVQVTDVQTHASGTARPEDAATVPSWWRVYEGLSDQEVDPLDASVRQRADLTRKPA
jgi:hypothetical protein